MTEPLISESMVERAALAALAPAVRKSFYTSILSIAIFSALLSRFSPDGILAWIGLRALVTVIGLYLIWRTQLRQVSVGTSITVIAVVLGASGVVWGLIPLFVRPDAPEWRAIVVLWLFGNQSVITAVCSSSPRAFRWGLGSVTVVGAVSMALSGDSFGILLGCLLLLGGVYSVSLFAPTHRAVRAAIEGQLKTELLAASLSERQAQLEQANLALAELASKDTLTGLPNRRTFVSNVSDANDRIREDSFIGYLDLDDFKLINDSLGHGAGDAVLLAVSERWRAILPDGALLARMGGDEFAVHMPGIDLFEAQEVVECFARSLNKPIVVGEIDSIFVSCSIGVCAVKAGEDYSRAIARADAALYQMKADRKTGNARGRGDLVEVAGPSVPIPS